MSQSLPEVPNTTCLTEHLLVENFDRTRPVLDIHWDATTPRLDTENGRKPVALPAALSIVLKAASSVQMTSKGQAHSWAKSASQESS